MKRIFLFTLVFVLFCKLAIAQVQLNVSLMGGIGATTMHTWDKNDDYWFDLVDPPVKYEVIEKGANIPIELHLSLGIKRLRVSLAGCYSDFHATSQTQIYSNNNVTKHHSSIDTRYTFYNGNLGLGLAMLNKKKIQIIPSIFFGFYGGDINTNDVSNSIMNEVFKSTICAYGDISFIIKPGRLGIIINPSYDFKYYKSKAIYDPFKGFFSSANFLVGIQYPIIPLKTQ